MTPDRWAGCGAVAGGGARCIWSGARGGDTGSALIFTLLGDTAGGGVPPPPSTGKLLLLDKRKYCQSQVEGMLRYFHWSI